MSENEAASAKRSEFKYKIGKVKHTPTVQKDERNGLSFIELKPSPDEKVYGCTKFAGHYKEEKKLGQGTFGEVYKGIHLETQRQVAMKRIIVNVDKELFPITAHREITILRRLNHKNVIKLIEMVYDYPPGTNVRAAKELPYQSPSGKPPLMKSFYMILPYMVSDLSGILHNPRITLSLGDIKCIILQLLDSLNYIHCQKYMHRDIKTANILIDHNGVVKLADFGLARLYYGAPPTLDFPGGAGSGAKYTSVVVTRWYRAPELVLGDKLYTTAVDMWGVGCVFAECFEKKPVLQGTTDIDQGHVIFKLLGTPTEEQWPLARYLPGAELTRTNYPGTLRDRFGKNLSETGLDFLKKLLALDPYKRLTAMSAIQHPFFKEEPLPCGQLVLPCEESHEADIKRYKEEMHQAMSQKAPSAPRGHVTESASESESIPVFPRAPKPKACFPTGPAASSRRPPPSGTVLSRNQPISSPYNRNQTSRFNYQGNNNGHGGVNKPPYTTNFHKSRYNGRYANTSNNRNNNTNFSTGLHQTSANTYQNRNAPSSYSSSLPQQPSRYQGTNEKYYQQHHSRDQRSHSNNNTNNNNNDGNNNNKHSPKPRFEDARAMRASGSSAPLPRGPATTNVPPSSPLASMPRENVQHIHPQEHELNDDDKQGSSKNENGTSENNKKDIADLY
ncbi:serine/threonine protein kinase, CMGC, CDC2/CDK sub [Zygosaccharomyces mellis]|uniref:Serine/threonine-protein kinase BUR1 n=1 Tax=Zygosaccharomyces mellis TaxID=42258 RepID=A0A4C2EDW1_9SACH|nr:serine/threonine protein kinase, CMGC, CDC2/CDK sub [Zygosaccharomyces mellis]